MLMLVTADNLLQLFFGWEGVGLCSYLLIGFWYDRPSANAAAIKAFVVNRIGDFGFILGILAVYFVFDTIAFDTIFAAAPQQAATTIEFLGMRLPTLEIIRSEEHTSELQSLMRISYAVFCLKKKKKHKS